MAWKYRIRSYYKGNVKPPKLPGELALETVHADEVSRDIEIEAYRQRTDIGRVEVFDLTKAALIREHLL